MGPSVLGFRSTAFLRILVEVLRDFLEDIRIDQTVECQLRRAPHMKRATSLQDYGCKCERTYLS